MAESKKKLKSFLMKMKKESEKAGLKTQHSKNEDHGKWSHHFMASRWETMATMTDIIKESQIINAKPQPSLTVRGRDMSLK